MGPMTRIHEWLLKRGLLSDLLPSCTEDHTDDKEAREAARVEIAARVVSEAVVGVQVRQAIARLDALNDKNHYGESIRRAFGGM